MTLDAPSIRSYCANVIDVVIPDMFNRVFVSKVGQPTTKSGREPVSQELVKLIKSKNFVIYFENKRLTFYFYNECSINFYFNPFFGNHVSLYLSLNFYPTIILFIKN
jgi:hypothetical protein